MIRTKEVQRNYKETVVDKYVCDLCSRESNSDDWNPNSYEVDSISINRRVGTNYPEGGNQIVYTFDMCPDCWNNKFLPWMTRNQGANPPREREFEF